MNYRLVLVSTFIALCVGRQYAEKQYGHICSGQPLAKLGPGAFKQDITMRFPIYEGIACYAEKGVYPETCVDEEWIHYVSKVPRSSHKLLFFYYCADADANPKRKCSKYLARCLFDTPYINKYDISACRKLFHDFNIGELPAEDTGSGNNACILRNDFGGNNSYNQVTSGYFEDFDLIFQNSFLIKSRIKV
ncbi:hypothetical protein KUTeg_015301 [Tegillarca granosa]|uniref:Uncharacterized protein n=1 Tax=Tegillarca granosa TaxID=220873 RepID=A0ABQ9ETC5_TEGGR|nr:hypothetical protein KUTeg_015301 [Tegillarca granosa]